MADLNNVSKNTFVRNPPFPKSLYHCHEICGIRLYCQFPKPCKCSSYI